MQSHDVWSLHRDKLRHRDPPPAPPIKIIQREREVPCTDKHLIGEECCEAISFLKHSSDESAVKEKMRAMFQYRWDSDLSTILLLLHLLPPTSKGHKKREKISSCQAVDHVVRYLHVCKLYCTYAVIVMILLVSKHFLIGFVSYLNVAVLYFMIFIISLLNILSKMGATFETFLTGVEPGQPFLLCVGENKSSIQRYDIIIDHKAQTSLAAFDELFKAHFIFSINYYESLYNFYTLIQTTVFNIDVCQGKSQSQGAKSKIVARCLR
ncbi:hypothetical protein XENOCAPTIV_014383 [Xenoophorus captivus]|uniref:Uncharacterized protein n=1 Tax=Xenoophorus captivus TaxID=1517983 RepID=A0ABV0RA13_9TELE